MVLSAAARPRTCSAGEPWLSGRCTHRHMQMPLQRLLPALLIAVFTATACTQAPAPPLAAASLRPRPSSTPSLAAAAVVPGACGITQVLKGGVPAWLDDAGAHNNPNGLPYAVATPPIAAGFLFGYPLRAGHPDNPANKILWVVGRPRGGSALTISAHPIGMSAPLVTTIQPANSLPGEIYPSIVDVPDPGCWHLDLAWAGEQASVEVEYQ